MTKKADNIALQLGKKVRTLRKKQGLTQEELATRSKLGVKHIQFIESKSPNNSNILTLQKLANGLDISVSELMHFED